jgi:multiple sugar transport system permease protein
MTGVTTSALRPRAVRWLRPAARAVFLAAAAIFTLAPIVWAIATSVRTPAESFSTPPAWIPKSPHLSNYNAVFDQVDFWGYAINSTLVTGLVVVGQVASSAMAGYAFARFDFALKRLLFGLVLATLMVPIYTTIVPQYMLIKNFGLTDTLLALVLPAWPNAFGTFLMRQHFLRMPADWDEAATLDGASPWRVFRSIYLPLSKSSMAVVAVIAFNYFWNELFRPLIFLNSEHNFTLPLGLVSLRGDQGSGSISIVLAGVVLSAIPSILVFAFGQRHIREGVTAGGLR